MNTPSLAVNSLDIYGKGFIIPMADNKFLLKRNKFVYKATGNKDETHIVIEGQNIWDIAFNRLGSSKFWFIIMDANPTILNPFEIDIGTELIIPDIEKIRLQV